MRWAFQKVYRGQLDTHPAVSTTLSLAGDMDNLRTASSCASVTSVGTIEGPANQTVNRMRIEGQEHTGTPLLALFMGAAEC